MTAFASDSLLNRSVLGRYRVVSMLARGGMGAVYLGRTEGAEGFTKPVVIKRVLSALTSDREVAQMFVREARILSQLSHPNIVGVLDFGQQGEGSYITVLEYVRGYPLEAWHAYLRREGRQLPVDVALHVICRVLDALHYAHTLTRSDGTVYQVIHRDVTPSNIVISERGEVKLLDFGIARVSGDLAEFQTERPRIKGKLPYLPLEMFQGKEPTVQSDLYSTGVVLYELLTGINPFVGHSTADIYVKIMSATPQSVHAVRDDAPEDIDSVLARVLNRDPLLRFASAAEFAHALRALRRDSDENIQQQLVALAGRDFAGAMPAALGLDSLSERDAAWRNTGSSDASDGGARTSDQASPVTYVADSQRAAPAETPTVQLAPDPQLLFAAGADVVSTTSALSARRLLAVAGVAGLVGALAAAGLWLGLANSTEPAVVVVERGPVRSNPVTAPPEQPAQPASAQPATPAPIEAAPAPSETHEEAITAPAQQAPKHAPPPPSPQALTRAFGHRQARVEACFAKHATSLSADPHLSLHFHVGTSGDVVDVQLEPAALASSPLGECLLKTARSSYFGPQQHDVSFRIPIVAQKKL
jgi:serine/threonine-protein kinase